MASAEMLVELVYCPAPGQVDHSRLQLEMGATVMQALQASGVLQRQGLQPEGLRLGVWGRVCEPGAVLREGDRVEIYRGLVVDPKEARRLRYQKHRAQKPAAARRGR
jgi:putative ubiquitin-RnfH superfamily antitoxin RatB of RatAB toxin-antitoxin module